MTFTDCKFSSISVEELGRFHGKLYAIKYTDEELFASIKKRLVESRYSERGTNKGWELYLKLGIQRAIQTLRQSNENIVPDAFLERLQHIMANTYFYQRKCVQPTEPMAIICHGDFLRNNIAFRYNDDGHATDAMLFDFQTLRYASPMVDLCTFMANSTGRDIRDKHFSEIFDAYHRTLTKHLLAATKWSQVDIPDYLKYVIPILFLYMFMRRYALLISFYLFVEISLQKIDKIELGKNPSIKLLSLFFAFLFFTICSFSFSFF